MRASKPKVKTLLICLAAAVFSIAAALASRYFSLGGRETAALSAQSAEQPGFVGSDACAACHAVQERAWKSSQHAHAMQEAGEIAVLGDFNEAHAQHFSSKARFFRRDDRFFVETDGKDGRQAEFEVKYTFGIDPLQQYLAEFPDGRLQALPYAWDARPKMEGGQRWFHLYPSEDVPHGDALHWTGPQQNWNHMCAECHATNVRKNYDAAEDRFHTTFSEVSVGCEACHGPGSGHIRWAQIGRPSRIANSGFSAVPLKRGALTWAPGPKTGSPAASSHGAAWNANETCDRCHSRRGRFTQGWKPGQSLADAYMPVFLTSDLFEDDGQMKDEVFNTSSFQQSKMFAKGVVCTDCHDPHSGTLKATKSEVCSQCHAAEKFTEAAHTGHQPGPNAPDCIACHMPARTYMVVDGRHDHSFRVPRPDLSVKIGVPNACASCHKDHDAGWAAAAVVRWHGPVRKGFQTYAEAFHAARLDLPEARDLLLKVAQDPATPAIARATALVHLRGRTSSAAEAEIERALRDPDAMVRIGALRALQPFPFNARWTRAKAALSDPVGAVRIEAAALLADAATAQLGEAERDALVQASQDYVAAKQENADRAEERANLGSFYVRQGKADLAEPEYRAAIKLSPRQVPPRVDLADLYRATGREVKAEELLHETIALLPEAAAPHHALGLALIRQKRYEEALLSLKRASELEPAHPRYAYVYAAALQSAGRIGEARQVLSAALIASPSNVDILVLLLQDALEARDLNAALSFAERLRTLRPEDAQLARLTEKLKLVVR
jgi:predicted CXXCH cytochrome family protein